MGLLTCRVCGAVPWGLLTKASSGWRRVIGIADQGVLWVAPCRADCWAGRCLGASGWRRVLGIADQGVEWMAHWDGVVIGIGGQGVLWVARVITIAGQGVVPCVWDC